MITSLEDSSGVSHTAHHDKVHILLDAYIERLGQSEFGSMLLDLEAILPQSMDLSILEESFTTEEIDQVIASLPTDKSPGPYGFNTDFIKKCWPIIKQDFYDLCQAFYSGNVCLQSINGSCISLIPKTDGPTKVNDFRPISPLNTSMKIITKLLANRLQLAIQQIIHKN